MRLIVMAALTVGDELSEAAKRMRRLEEELTALQDARVASSERAQATQVAVAAALNSASERIEHVTRSLNQSLGEGDRYWVALLRAESPTLPKRGCGVRQINTPGALRS